MSTIETVVAVLPSAPQKPLPAGACDCHAHVFGPLSRFPTGPSTYAIPLAEPEIYAEMLGRVGFARGILVQPAPHGRDTGALENALSVLGGRVRGIAVADSSITDAELERLHAAGVRGLRFIEMRDPRSGQRYAGSVGMDDMLALAPRMKALGWHAQVWARCADIPEIVAKSASSALPLVFDHMGQYDAEEGLNATAFQAFLALVKDGRIWTKLSVCRISKEAPYYDDISPFHAALIEANPERLLWGSDWPFVRMGVASPDVGNLIDIFTNWVGNDATVRQILAENPARLFDFSA